MRKNIMKKTALILVLVMALSLSACGNTAASSGPSSPSAAPSAPLDESPEEIPAVPQTYAETLDLYAQALSEQWNGNELTDKGLNHMVRDCYGDAPLENIGYLIADLDGDGNQELVIGVTEAVTDEFYGKVVLDLYTAGQDTAVFSSTERDRLYYAGGSQFASLGSSSASESFETTVKLEGGELIDMTRTTDPADYVQMELIHMSQWSGDDGES